MSYALLLDRAVFAASGEDARDFLQGLISNDIRKVRSGSAIFAALLSPQGKFLHDFFITEHEGALLFDTEKARLPDLLKRLSMYKLRSKVTVTERPELQVAASWGKTDLPKADVVFNDPRLAELGSRLIGTTLPAGEAEGYEVHRLSLGVPSGSNDLIPDRSLLLEYGYDELNAIDFSKGCYVGQEVTARSKHRASLHKFIHLVRGSAALPPKETKIMTGAREIGQMAGSLGNQGLALLRVADVRRAIKDALPIHAGEAVLHVQLPSWCQTPFAEESQK